MELIFNVPTTKILSGVYDESKKQLGEFLSAKIFHKQPVGEDEILLRVDSDELLDEAIIKLVDILDTEGNTDVPQVADDISNYEIKKIELFLSPRILAGIIDTDEHLELVSKNHLIELEQIVYTFKVKVGYCTNSTFVGKFNILDGGFVSITRID